MATRSSKTRKSAAAPAEPVAPWRFADLVGHARARESLLRALASGTVAHAYLFAGIDGVGKERAGWSLAAALNCADPAPDGDACGTCESCMKIAAGNHPDVRLVERDGASIKIHQVREVEGLGRHRPNEGRARIILFRDADTLGDNAANALLKTLEEPPRDTHFVLVSANPRRLLATVISRCQQLKFAPLANEEIAEVLRRRGASDADARLAAALGEGSVARALGALDPDVVAARRELVRNVEEASRARLLQGVFDVAESFKAGTFGDSGRREAVARRLEKLLAFYRDVLVVQVGAGAGVTPVNLDLEDLLEVRAESMSPAAALMAAEEVATAVAAVRRNANIQLTLERMVFGIRAAAGAVR